MSSPIDLVEEGAARVGAARTYRANARLTGESGDSGVRVRMDREGEGDGNTERNSREDSDRSR